jgi:hypothetical protein
MAGAIPTRSMWRSQFCRGPWVDLPGQRLVWTPKNSEAAVSVSTGERRTASAVEGGEGGEW